MRAYQRLRRSFGLKPAPLDVRMGNLEGFESDSNVLWHQALRSATRYAEYGIGKSTVYAALYFSASVRGVETDPRWVQAVQANVSSDRVELIHADVGEVGKWGRPLGYQHKDGIQRYFDAPYEAAYDPDVVLIDGRSRVACWATSMLSASSGSKLVFDDYPIRPQYSELERVCQPDEVRGNQALFVVPDKRPVTDLEDLLRDFRFVMD